LSINGITEDGQNAIAQHYDVLDEWKASKHEGDHVDTYYELLLLVKTKSKNDGPKGRYPCQSLTGALQSLLSVGFELG
jgi:hypothetical protein